MNHIRQHMPNFMDFPTEPDADFATLGELHAVPFVRRWVEDPLFRRLAQGSAHGKEYLLMADMADASFWVIGYLKEPVEGLPAWENPRH